MSESKSYVAVLYYNSPELTDVIGPFFLREHAEEYIRVNRLKVIAICGVAVLQDPQKFAEEYARK